jgi:hypothetical protein
VVATTFLELVAADEWFESPEIEGKTVAKVVMTIVLIEIAQSGLTWLRTHDMWLP